MKIYLYLENDRITDFSLRRKNDLQAEYEVSSDSEYRDIQLNFSTSFFRNGKIEIVHDFIKDEIQKNENKISELKTNLNSTDYKIIKCYEASILNEPMPYNIQELTTQRKQWREEINNLEFQLQLLK